MGDRSSRTGISWRSTTRTYGESRSGTATPTSCSAETGCRTGPRASSVVQHALHDRTARQCACGGRLRIARSGDDHGPGWWRYGHADGAYHNDRGYQYGGHEPGAEGGRRDRTDTDESDIQR